MPMYPKIHMLNPQPQCDDIRRQGLWEVIRLRRGHESGAPMMGSVPFKEEKETPALSVSTKGGYKNKAACKAGRWPDHASTLTSDLPASRTVRSKCLRTKPPSLWYFDREARTKIGTIIFCLDYYDNHLTGLPIS